MSTQPTPEQFNQHNLQTQGGSYVHGNIGVSRDFTGRDTNIQGDVNNYYVAQPLAPSAPLPKEKISIPPLLPYLVDRNAQRNALEDTISHVKGNLTQPLLCVIHGDDQQCHDKFMERLKIQMLPRLLDLPSNQDTIQEYILRWPVDCNTAKELDDGLRRNLGHQLLNKHDSSVDSIAETIGQRLAKSPIIIHTMLNAEQLWQYGDGAMSDYINFWQRWPSFLPGRYLIICLCIKYRTKHHASFFKRRMLQNKVSKLEKQLLAYDYASSPIPCTRLPKLESIQWADAEEWALDRATQYFCKGVNVVGRLQTIFDDWERKEKSSTIPMGRLADNLYQLLQEHGGL